MCFSWTYVAPQVMTEDNKNDPLSPLYIGPEKLLSLYSENNWGNFCLSYLLTNRDYSGVLGLAWEGRTGESDPSLPKHSWTNVEACIQFGQELHGCHLTSFPK